MKALLLFLFSFTALTANADSGPRISRWDDRNPKEVTLSFANRDVRYIEESACRGGNNGGGNSSRSRCQINTKDNAIESISNSRGERRYREQNANPLNFVLEAVSSGFCSFDQDTYCVATSEQSEYYSKCTPTVDTVLKLKIEGVVVFSERSPSVCHFSNERQNYGRADYVDYMKNERRRLEKICRVRSL